MACSLGLQAQLSPQGERSRASWRLHMDPRDESIRSDTAVRLDAMLGAGRTCAIALCCEGLTARLGRPAGAPSADGAEPCRSSQNATRPSVSLSESPSSAGARCGARLSLCAGTHRCHPPPPSLLLLCSSASGKMVDCVSAWETSSSAGRKRNMSPRAIWYLLVRVEAPNANSDFGARNPYAYPQRAQRTSEDTLIVIPSAES